MCQESDRRYGKASGPRAVENARVVAKEGFGMRWGQGDSGIRAGFRLPERGKICPLWVGVQARFGGARELIHSAVMS